MVEEAGFGGGDGLALFHPGAVGFNVGFGGTGKVLDDSCIGVEGVVCGATYVSLGANGIPSSPRHSLYCSVFWINISIKPCRRECSVEL